MATSHWRRLPGEMGMPQPWRCSRARLDEALTAGSGGALLCPQQRGLGLDCLYGPFQPPDILRFCNGLCSWEALEEENYRSA